MKPFLCTNCSFIARIAWVRHRRYLLYQIDMENPHRNGRTDEDGGPGGGGVGGGGGWCWWWASGPAAPVAAPVAAGGGEGGGPGGGPRGTRGRREGEERADSS
eukprot:COSAG02_NODE_214_length_28689_cov_34.895523_24_plen_103_part_00